ncbi:MAG: RHS repeat-associated core domain-containing protein [Candidatus Competibacter sp.]|nr:RHS repeat-associated core domain-containing protein [Candidatus Competibacteraceae bacterium]
MLPGQYYDTESGLHYNYMRDYDPQTGRYIQSDPVGLEGGVNSYLYTDGNPLANTDPTGEVAQGVLIGGVILGGLIVTTGIINNGGYICEGCQSANLPDIPKPIPIGKTIPTLPPPECLPKIPPKPDCDLIYNLCITKCTKKSNTLARKAGCFSFCTIVYLMCKIKPDRGD